MFNTRSLIRIWNALHKGKGGLVTTGIYSHIRHPQYVGFIAIIIGFLIQWPTLITLAMAPVLIVRYVRLAHKEVGKAIDEFGDAYRDYRKRVPAWFPRIGKSNPGFGTIDIGIHDGIRKSG